jgi:hypothetical protein
MTREKRKNEPHSNNGVVKSEIDNTIKTLDSSMEIIMAVARYDGNVENENDDNNKDKIETKSEPVSTTNIIKPDFSVSNKVVDLYIFIMFNISLFIFFCSFNFFSLFIFNFLI